MTDEGGIVNMPNGTNNEDYYSLNSGIEIARSNIGDVLDIIHQHMHIRP